MKMGKMRLENRVKFSLEQKGSGQVSMALYATLWNSNYVLKKMGIHIKGLSKVQHKVTYNSEESIWSNVRAVKPDARYQ